MADYKHQRNSLVDRLVEREYISQPAVIEALRTVPRHEFVPAGSREQAYHDRPLPIGDQQTISAPHMVGLMTELLDVGPSDHVLEIGTGCGYHAAVVAEVVGAEHVFSVEYSEQLAVSARDRLREQGYRISVRTGDGRAGWPAHAPYDAAYMTCAAVELPAALPEQVRTGGQIVAPIGTNHQQLYRFTVTDAGLSREANGAVRFVQMRG